MKTSSSENFRVAPLIPDHEMLRLIGKGSYGEVWLARSVTGAMRAVKVVQRSDFQYDKTFEREFEGIKKFEPSSRSHPGLVDVLHVGRNLSEGFYYYVMELGDDQVRGAEIIPELYVARTLSSDINQREDGRLSIDECVEAGTNLADGLHYLHQRGLTHRDVKPSNVIFVEGVAKLADIGLVAASGQRTFVGTEGFVPPEGPGSPAADIYSLGMVLYEVSTGNDRLEFPELPSRLPAEAERPKWRALNAVVCKACAQGAKDRYASAADFAQALQRIKSGRLRRKTLRGKLFRTLIGAGLLAVLIMLSRHGDFLQAVKESRALMGEIALRGPGATPVKLAAGDPVGDPDPPIEPPVEPVEVPVVNTGLVKIVSDPGVEIFTIEGEYLDEIGDSGVMIFDRRPFGPVSYRLQRAGFESRTISGTVTKAEPLLVLKGPLKVFQPPVEGEPWTNGFEMEFAWVEGRHVARLPVSAELFEKFRLQSDVPPTFYRASVTIPDPDLVGEQAAILVTPEVAAEFFEWLTRQSRAAGYLTAQHDYVLNEHAATEIVAAEDFNGAGDLVLLMCAVEQSEFALVTFTTDPADVEVFSGEKLLGTSAGPLRIETGPQVLTLAMPGYKNLEFAVDPEPGEDLKFEIEMEPSRAAVMGRSWINDLGMEFVPLGDSLLFGAHEVRVKDFRAFCDRAPYDWNHTPPYAQGDDHPVVKVKREDALAFCRWLTEVDRESGLLEPGFIYRLPKDLEWSRAAGLTDEGRLSPAARDGQVKNVYPWSGSWPPPNGVANLGARKNSAGEAQITGFSDEFVNTAPVGSFPPNDFGIYDLSGNVWEFVEEFYGGSLKSYGVVRGGGFSDVDKITLATSCRTPVRPGFGGVLHGFRVVIANSSGENPDE